ncbi:tyrosine-type recombinase/integrase [Chromatocurvus halotolerans]|uniref:Site-specific recombinase XerD n=1 Tax=Chromatocurvus halotolerans TaxID=1132028 RepID=A0A4R2KRT7_9GAMM|nr:tyrosine-type recombinase/integrase [Chromatocurvus halotolerans]TCO73689.1 site-specific recombinase XerD [Chromatocurvus halotolerans]
MPKIRLTQKHLDKPPPCPTGKRRVEYCDIAIPGLYLEVRDTCPDQGTLYLRYKNPEAKTCHRKLGNSQELSLKEARHRATRLKAEIALGADPQAETRQRKAVPTWNRFFEDSYLPHAKQAKRTWKNDADMQRLRLSDRFGVTPINKITRHAVQQFHDELLDEGMKPATADHHLKLLRHALNLAVDWGLLGENPAAKVKQFNADNQIERYLTQDELQRLLTVLKQHPNRPVCCAILWLLATGARVGEALSAQWSDIDRDRGTWLIQATNSKSKKRRSVALNSIALGVLDELEALPKRRTSDRLFVGKCGPLGTINKVWCGIRTQAGLENFRLHDLRHSYASMLINSGHSLFEVQQSLGHSDPKVTMRYAHLSNDSLQRAANSAGDLISQSMPK